MGIKDLEFFIPEMNARPVPCPGFIAALHNNNLKAEWDVKCFYNAILKASFFDVACLEININDMWQRIILYLKETLGGKETWLLFLYCTVLNCAKMVHLAAFFVWVCFGFLFFCFGFFFFLPLWFFMRLTLVIICCFPQAHTFLPVI